MKRLLRSVINFEDGKINDENLSVNWARLSASNIEWTRPTDQRIYNFITEFFQDRLELPTAQTLKDFFTRASDDEVLERIKDIEAAQSYVRTNFAHLLQQQLEDQNRIKMLSLLKEAEEVTSKGLVIELGRGKTQRIQGVKDAYSHFTRQAHELLPTEYNVKNRGDIREDAGASWQEYEDAKHNKGKAWGAFTGINHIDKVVHGLKPGELWTHAAAPGHLKTMFATNWAYNLVTRYRRNIVYFTLEVQYHHIRRIMAVLHSAHPKFRAQGYHPLSYRAVRDGELEPDQEKFYKEVVLPDWYECEDFCHFEVIAPEDDITITDMRLETELLHKQFEVGMVFIDHSELVKHSSRDSSYTIRLNDVVKSTKKFALHFNGGQGVPICMLHQINREGEEYAMRNEGRYRKRDLSYANEVEKSSDVITTTYLDDEHRSNGTAVCTNLKSRDNPHFDPFLLNVDFDCRRLHNLNAEAVQDIDAEEADEVLTAMMEAV